MLGTNDIVITGLGCVSPIGIGRDNLLAGLQKRKCGIRLLHRMSGPHGQEFYGAACDDFDAKVYVTPRKALKVMNREVQTAYSAAHLAWQDANMVDAAIECRSTGCGLRFRDAAG